MSDVSSIAAGSTAISQQQVASEIATKVLKLANEQQKSALALLEGAVEVAEQVAESGGVDTRA